MAFTRGDRRRNRSQRQSPRVNATSDNGTGRRNDRFDNGGDDRRVAAF